MKKNNIYLLLLICISTLFVSCGDDIGFSVTEAQRSPNFVNTDLSVAVPQEDLILDIPITVTSLSTSERVYEIEVISFTGSAAEYSFTSAKVPANQLEGSAQVSLDFSAISDEDLREVKLKMLNPDGAPSNEITIEYFKEVVCNDLNLYIFTDTWASETSFSITEADGTEVVAQFAPFASDGAGQEFNQDFSLPDGDYIFTLFDAFCDGNATSTTTGSVLLTCAIITHVSQTGNNFGCSVEFPFSVNP